MPAALSPLKSSQPLLSDDFLLETKTARRLFHEIAAGLPIVDFHNHLPPADIAANRRFVNLWEAWLEGDHYKWRAMRAHGIPEHLISGDSSPREKFLAWAETVPATWRSPLYHWTHLELARYFDIQVELTPETAQEIWDATETRLAEPQMSTRGLLEQQGVEIVCTTDDPADPLPHHESFAQETSAFRMFPTFRPDAGMALTDLPAWNAWVDRLAATAQTPIADFADFLSALKRRHDAFHTLGARFSDHGLTAIPFATATDAEVDTIFKKARSGVETSSEERAKFVTRVLLEIGRWNHARGWTMQLHLGPIRNNSTRMFRTLGRDAGFDSIGDFRQIETLAAFLDALDVDDQLPRVVLYNVDPAMTYPFAAMAANFNGGGIPGKVQLGAAWWFLDQKDGIEWNLDAISNLGLLRHFIGMITDSRSFLSFPRHEYFRRILCNKLGHDVERGLLPANFDRLTEYLVHICHRNARARFQH